MRKDGHTENFEDLKKGKFVSDIATLVLFDMGIREA
jgi:hypothetical protein